MKKIFVFLLALCVVFTFVSCVENVEIVTGDELGGNVGEIASADVTKATTEATTAPEPVKNYPDNILMADSQTISTAKVFQNEAIYRSDIKTVTFLDTLKDKGADAWDVSDAKDGSVWAWVDDGMNLYIAGEGGVTAKDCSRMFMYYKNMTEINFNGCFYTDIAPDLYEMFVYCDSLESIDLSTLNTSNIEHITGMFHRCYKLKSVNVSGWDTSKMVSMKGAFLGCSKLENIDVSHFDTSNAKSFDSMFFGCEKLTTVGDLSGWNTSNVIYFTTMFNGCSNLATVGDLSGWDTSNATSMYGMFSYCKNLSSIGDLKIPEGCDTTDMFEGTSLK